MLNSNDRLETIAHFRMAVEGAMQVVSYAFDQENPRGPVKLQGRLLMPPAPAYRKMRVAFEQLGYTPASGPGARQTRSARSDDCARDHPADTTQPLA